MLSAIEATDGLDDVLTKINTLEVQMKAQQERAIQMMESNIKLQEKASDAIALAREAAAVSKGTAREVDASLISVRSEVKSAIEGVEAKMKALQKATTNRLDIN